MTTEKTSQAQHPFFPSLPGFPAMPGLDAWRSVMEAQTERFEKMTAELERMERERHERALTALEDMAKLMKSTLEYQRELTTEWRKMGLEAAKKSAELVGAV
jgi:hypothetical protein